MYNTIWCFNEYNHETLQLFGKYATKIYSESKLKILITKRIPGDATEDIKWLSQGSTSTMFINDVHTDINECIHIKSNFWALIISKYIQ